MANLYKRYAKADIKNEDGGYKNVILFAPADSFSSIKKPVVGETPALGDRLTIATAHTFGTSDGFISLSCKTHSVTLKSQTVGDDGSGRLEHTFSVTAAL